MTEEVQLLLVEDDPLIRLSVEDALQNGGYSVICACSGAEALEILDTQPDQIAGVITDIKLGAGPDGWVIAQHARELNGLICVAYVTGDSAADWPARGVPKSVILQKPFADAQLLTAISTLLNEVSGADLPTRSGR